jgi:hypothetical protein
VERQTSPLKAKSAPGTELADFVKLYLENEQVSDKRQLIERLWCATGRAMCHWDARSSGKLRTVPSFLQQVHVSFPMGSVAVPESP